MPSVIRVGDQTLALSAQRIAASHSDTHSFPVEAAVGSRLCLNCVASLSNSGNEFTLSLTSIVFTRFQEQPAGCGAFREWPWDVDPPCCPYLTNAQPHSTWPWLYHTCHLKKDASIPCVWKFWMYSNLRLVNNRFLDRALLKTAGSLGCSPLSSSEAEELMPIFGRCLFFLVLKSGPTPGCYSTCIHFLHIISAGPGSNKPTLLGKEGLCSMWSVHSLRSREEMPKPAQHQNRLRFCYFAYG